MAGTRTDTEWVGEAKADFTATRLQVSKLKTPKEFAEAHDLYLASADLYVSSVRAYEGAIGATDRTQFDLLARRLRELGDRVFDRGRAALGITRGATPDIQVNDPEEVPIWTAEGLAAGPPLDDPPPPPAASPPLRAATRPEQSRGAWERDVARANAPAATELRTSDQNKLRSVARQFVAAAEYLRDKPDPRGGREESARLRLSWLAYADAARARQLAIADALIRDAAAMIRP